LRVRIEGGAIHFFCAAHEQPSRPASVPRPREIVDYFHRLED
jgi:hypothetical protein